MNHVKTGKDKPRSYNGDYMEVGRNGEEIVIAWLKQRPAVLGITDFRKIREVHEADIDAGVRLYNGHICLVEIKTDTWLGRENGNVLFEVLRINHTSRHEYAGYLGWSLRSPAEQLMFYAPNRSTGPAIYQTSFKRYRSVLQSYSQFHDVTFTSVRTDAQKTTYNILIPEQEIKDVFKIHALPKDDSWIF